jgi:hypothetical protein
MNDMRLFFKVYSTVADCNGERERGLTNKANNVRESIKQKLIEKLTPVPFYKDWIIFPPERQDNVCKAAEEEICIIKTRQKKNSSNDNINGLRTKHLHFTLKKSS